MISINELKNGLFIKLDGELFVVMEADHYKPGKGGAMVRTRLRNIITGAVIDRTFRSAETLEDVYIDEKAYQYLYYDGSYHFMDNETYEQLSLTKDVIGDDAAKFLKENVEITASIHDGKILRVRLPLFLNFKVTETEPGVRGDTVKSGLKNAKIETGATVWVPLFVNTGDTIIIDTRTGKYTGRA